MRHLHHQRLNQNNPKKYQQHQPDSPFFPKDIQGNSKSHEYCSTICNKKMSQNTSSSLQQHDTLSGSNPESPVTSQFDLEQELVRDECGKVEHSISRNDIQNQLIEKGNLVRYTSHTDSESYTHNQYNMQAQVQPLESLQAECHLPSPQELLKKEHKLTPNTEAPSSPHQSHIEEPHQSNKVPQLSPNCRFKPQSKMSKQELSRNPSLSKNSMILTTQPIKETYYKNRVRLIEWLSMECVKLELSRETFANALFLMDFYFKRASFNSNEFFMETALSMLVIASKMNQSKILFTVRMAINNGLDKQSILNRELEIISWFRFKVDPYNFVRIVEEYIIKWDQYVQKNKLSLPIFIGQTLENFLLYQKLFYLCENQLKNQGELLVSTIKVLFEELLRSITPYQRQAKQMLQYLFEEKNQFAKNEDLYVFECLSYESQNHDAYISKARGLFKTWIAEFDRERKSEFTDKLEDFKRKEISHKIYLTLQF